MNNEKVTFDEKMDEIEYLRQEVARLRLQLDNAIVYIKIVTEESMEKGRRLEDRKCLEK
jgi:hypothetical protein